MLYISRRDLSKTIYYDILNLRPGNSTTDSLPASREAHAQAYRRFIRFEGADQESSPYIHVEVSGGYRYQDIASAPYPDYGEDGSFHALSGDHIVLLIRSLSDRDLFLRIIHFGCDYGVETVYPSIDLVQEIPTFQQTIQQTEILLHFRVGSPTSCGKENQTKTHLHECLKIFVSDQLGSFKFLEALQTNTTECPQKLSDPVKWALTEDEPNGSEDHGNMGNHMLDIAVAHKRLGAEFNSEDTLEPGRGAWSCQNVLYAIHTDPNSLKGAVRA